MILQIRNSPKLEDKTTLDFYLALVDMEIDVRVAEIGDEYRLAGRK